ncbi:MAG: bifunctional demethylmenaquinone methyltransferase/2-methoxy-6-polyprenyl-1,4-benzoquinol methylase UbiE [Armatimonadaceae bacterium]
MPQHPTGSHIEPGNSLVSGASPLPAPEQKHDYVRALFDGIAPRYDLLNSLLSARLHHGWRRFAAKLASLKPGDSALDVCTGTGDLAFELANHVGQSGSVVGTDFSAQMLVFGEKKRTERQLSQVRLIEADTQTLPFADNSFDAATVAFGIRNVADRARGFAEMTRVVRSGGRVVVLEFNQPRHPLLAPLYRWYSFRVLPWVGGLVSGRRMAYAYLPASVAAFPSREELAGEMQAAGLTDVRFYDLTGGIVVAHIGIKP